MIAEFPVSACVWVPDPVVSIMVVLDAKSKFYCLAPSFELIEVTLLPLEAVTFLRMLFLESPVPDAILSSSNFRRPSPLLIR